MSGYSSFQYAQNTRIGDYAQFNQARNVFNINNNRGTVSISQYGYRGEPSIVPIQHRSKEIDPEDIIYQKQILSQTKEVIMMRSPFKTNNPFRNLVPPTPSRVKVQKKVYSAEIVQFRERSFTVFTFEPEDEEDEEAMEVIWERVYKASSAQKSLSFPQLFGVGQSQKPMLIVHDEHANGKDFVDQYVGSPIVWEYLWYTNQTIYWTLRQDETLAKLSIPISNAWGYWMFNLRTASWHYDPTSVALTQLPEEEQPCDNAPTSTLVYKNVAVPSHVRPDLNAGAIAAVLEYQFGDAIDLVLASYRRLRPFDQLNDFARHDLLTLGAVVDRRKTGILAHFPSTPSPEWRCRNLKGLEIQGYSSELGSKFRSDSRIRGSFSKSVPSRVDLSFSKTPIAESRAVLNFCLSLPQNDFESFEFKVAYLAQSFSFYDDCGMEAMDHLAFIDEFRLCLTGVFSCDPKTLPRPAYLFVPPIPVETINSMPCVRYPLPEHLFYWSFDPSGRDVIPEEDWAAYSIPKLEPKLWMGSFWSWSDYGCIGEYFRLKNYDGVQYARDRNRPIMIRGDPHDVRIVDCETLVLNDDGDGVQGTRLGPLGVNEGLLHRPLRETVGHLLV